MSIETSLVKDDHLVSAIETTKEYWEWVPSEIRSSKGWQEVETWKLWLNWYSDPGKETFFLHPNDKFRTALALASWNKQFLDKVIDITPFRNRAAELFKG